MQRPHILNVSFVGLKPEVVVHALEEHGVYVSTKSACSSKANEVSRVLVSMGVPHAQALFVLVWHQKTQWKK